MRKLICVFMAVMMMLSAGIPVAFASHHGHNRRFAVRQVQEVPEYCQFADEDQNGICDQCKNICTECENSTDEDCNGVCDVCGNICHKCDGARDIDSNGICDGCGMCPYETDQEGNHFCRCDESCKNADRKGYCASTGTSKSCKRGFRHH